MLSRALQALERPASARRNSDVTTGMFGRHVAPDGSRYLMVDTEHVVQIHAEAEMSDIATILQTWVGQGLTTGDITALEAVVEERRGQGLVVWEAFPEFFKSVSKSHEEMIAAGLLAEPGGMQP